MTEPDPSALSRGLTSRQVRDIAALLLIVIGVVGLLACAFTYAPLLGWAATFAALAAAGATLGYARDSDLDDSY